jgi:peptidoglycan/xylan/chitin deacetylase (PgdA/CDA1 family)
MDMKDDETRIKTAYLTFDDGPNENTDSILKILHYYGVKATFFNIGSRLKMYRSLVKEMIDKGHNVGHHSMSHDYSKLYTTRDAFI